ncbi:hypothetical protein PF005_g23265 [Phytophthora fragariae]|uniref:START domain-containing protein n=1 Tax=Phytophthora fragariae TaxID=53985 RepID=A0A6A3ILK4_9STRA|nr:hypothetical protein PF011_g21977 [Phytophthora fragariae]KAE9079690.1 hypothetical protein PF007_g23351 [Phytophthora fragariae]KAE9180458.1 hypothetical protein PF005_g23265 [Phytophthora fragariae]KAE9299647.1 hypothetical protein PF008_g23194 [Phytophthora fragariae]
MKERFLVNPFRELNLTPADASLLEDLANQCITSNLEHYTKFISSKKRVVDLNRWKLIKEGHKLKVYSERAGQKPSAADIELTGEDLETMRIKASYVDDVSGAAVLTDLVRPTMEKPFHTLLLKWMEMDIPFRSTNFVKNCDYVYLEGTGYTMSSQGERIGYHLLHSVSFPQTGELPSRVRGNMSNIGFWRQIGPNTIEMYATSIMDPVDKGMIRKLAVPAMASGLLSSLKYAYCGQMRKLTFMLDRKYAESKLHGAPNKARVCTTCTAPVSSRRMGDFGKSGSTCKLCFGFLCSGCKIVRKLSFVDPDMKLTQRKVTFCTACISEVTSMSAVDVARARIVAQKSIGERSSFIGALSSSNSAGDSSYSS